MLRQHGYRPLAEGVYQTAKLLAADASFLQVKLLFCWSGRIFQLQRVY